MSRGFLLALLLTAVGGSAFFYLIAFAVGWRDWMLIGAGTMCFLGAVWLYSDFVDATPNKP
jgi:hypothetical protein